MNRIITPNEDRSAEEELTETSFRDPRPDDSKVGDEPSMETTTTDGEELLQELGEDVSSSPAQRGRPTTD